MTAGRTGPVLRYMPFVLLLIAGTLLGIVHDRAAREGKLDPVSSLVRTVISLPANATSFTTRWFSREFGWIPHGYRLEAENRSLSARVTALEMANTSLKQQALTGQRLAADLGIVSTHTPKPEVAQVIALRPDPNFETIIINRGSNSGIKVHDVVITPIGLVGQVYVVNSSTAGVVLLTDQNGMVSARVERANSRAVGICRGNYTDTIVMNDLSAEADIHPGDRIVTAGYGVFPPGIPIGTVLSVALDQGQMNKVAVIKPFVDFGALDEVIVLR